MSSSGSIFLSYRRTDTISETGRIYDRLAAAFGREHVFKDVDNIPLGVDFAEYIDQEVSRCRVLLVVMGKTWITTTEADGTRRLDNPDDFVRIEIESALKRDIPVVPLLLEGVIMPKRFQLPGPLQPFARRNGTVIGYDPRFHDDMDRLIRKLQPALNPAEPVSEPIVVAPSSTFSFEVVTVDAKGKIRHREQRSAEFRQESLGQGVELEMVAIPAGTFYMGSAEGQGYDRERPQHKVTVQPFFMGKYSVTQAQWLVVSGFERIDIDLTPYPSKFEGDKRPVEQMSWDEAVEFCKRLSKHTNRAYRLPSEAEWEYACRAGTQTAFHYGETITTDLANYRGTELKIGDTTYPGRYGLGPFGEYREQTIEVDNFSANTFGLYDMHGNVLEWCQDCWHENYEGAPNDENAWKGNDTEGYRLLRGGSWLSNPDICRSASRDGITRVNRNGSVGFRVVCGSSWTLR